MCYNIAMNSKELGVLILTVEHNYICLCYYKKDIITMTCFGPICGLSSGCDLDFWISYTGMRGAFLGSLGGGGEILLYQWVPWSRAETCRCYNILLVIIEANIVVFDCKY